MSTMQRAAAFDGIAAEYDDIFTRSLIGRTQRNAVWEIIRQHFQPSDSVLELNCGTGEDAIFLARCGMKVVACDISARMIEVARSRRAREAPRADGEFHVLATEDLATLPQRGAFDAVFSNFSGLNCVADLPRTACDIAHLIRPGGKAVLCLTNKHCLWEIAWYSIHGHLRKAFRRINRKAATATIGNATVIIRYPRLSAMVAAFAPYFRLVAIRGIGITVPPSYLEPWARRMPGAIALGAKIDRLISRWPLVRAVGDHVVLVLERTAA